MKTDKELLLLILAHLESGEDYMCYAHKQVTMEFLKRVGIEDAWLALDGEPSVNIAYTLDNVISLSLPYDKYDKLMIKHKIEIVKKILTSYE